MPIRNQYFPASVSRYLDPNERAWEPAITDMWSWGREKVLAEIAKCEICANCHRERSVLSMRRAA